LPKFCSIEIFEIKIKKDKMRETLCHYWNVNAIRKGKLRII